MHDATNSQSASRVPVVPSAPTEESTAKDGLGANAGTQVAEGQSADPEMTRVRIAEAAYYRAEKRGFAPGAELQDWLDAETEMMALLR